MKISSVGIVGHGKFGAFLEVLLKRFAPGVEIKIFSPHEKLQTPFYALEEVATCDVVVLAVPIHAFEEVLKQILPHIRSQAVIVDVATVKVHTVEILKRLAAGRHYIATHPMFGPESYEKKDYDVSGFRVVITEHSLKEKDVAVFCKMLEMFGFKVLRMDADTHDKQLAETLFLTHFIGQVVARSGFERTDIDTVSFGYLMDAVDSVRHDAALFADVFKYNSYCSQILDRFEAGERNVRKLLEA